MNIEQLFLVTCLEPVCMVRAEGEEKPGGHQGRSLKQEMFVKHIPIG